MLKATFVSLGKCQNLSFPEMQKQKSQSVEVYLKRVIATIWQELAVTTGTKRNREMDRQCAGEEEKPPNGTRLPLHKTRY